MPQSGIYAITNTLTNDVYIGSSCNIERRKVRHFRELRQGKHHSQYLQRAFTKYGESAFEFKVIEDVQPERKLLIEREQHWIETTHPAYNMNPLATNNQGMKASEAVRQHLLKHSLMRTSEQRRLDQLGKKRSEETKRRQSEAAKARRKPTEEERKKLSESAKNREYTEEGRKKRSEAMKARWKEKPLGEESIQKMRASNTGKKRSTEARANISKAHIGVKRSEESRRKQSGTMKGATYSEERRKRISEGRKAAWDRKKREQAKALDIQQDSLFD